MLKYLTDKEVADLTGLGVQTLRNWRFEGRGIPYCKIGRAVRYEADEVAAYMAARRVTTADDPRTRRPAG